MQSAASTAAPPYARTYRTMATHAGKFTVLLDPVEIETNAVPATHTVRAFS